MTIDVRDVGRICIMSFGGRLVLGEPTDLMTRKFKDLLEKERRLFVFDMTGVPFMDSMGVGATIACHKNASQHDGVIKLVLSEKVKQIFVDICKLHAIFEIYDDVESALASFA